LIHFEVIFFYMVKDRGVSLLSSTYGYPVFSAQFIETFFYPLYILAAFVKSTWILYMKCTLKYMNLFWVHYSVPVVGVALFMPLLFYLGYYSFVVYFEVRYYNTFSFVLFVQDCFDYFGVFCGFTQILGVCFLFLWRTRLVFWYKLHWIFWFLWMVWTFFLTYWDLNAGPWVLTLELCTQPIFFFCFSYFSDKVLHSLPGSALEWDPLIYVFHIVGVTDVHFHSQLVYWDGVSLFFFWPGLASNHDPPDLFPQVAGITGARHCALPSIDIPAILILLIHEHGISFYFLCVTPMNSCVSVL
jgi:hypothetical protein